MSSLLTITMVRDGASKGGVCARLTPEAKGSNASSAMQTRRLPANIVWTYREMMYLHRREPKPMIVAPRFA